MPWSTLVAAFASRYGVRRRFSLPGFLRLCLARAQGSAVDLALPPLLSSPADDLLHISLQCPMLRRLALPQLPAADEARLAELVPRWPLLEHLELDAKPSSATFPALAEKLGRHCPKFASLKTSGAVKAQDAAALARWLPRLRSLCLDRSYMPRQELLAILARCRELKELSARGCVGFDDGDEEVARLRWLARFDAAPASRIGRRPWPRPAPAAPAEGLLRALERRQAAAATVARGRNKGRGKKMRWASRVWWNGGLHS